MEMKGVDMRLCCVVALQAVVGQSCDELCNRECNNHINNLLETHRGRYRKQVLPQCPDHEGEGTSRRAQKG